MGNWVESIGLGSNLVDIRLLVGLWDCLWLLDMRDLAVRQVPRLGAAYIGWYCIPDAWQLTICQPFH